MRKASGTRTGRIRVRRAWRYWPAAILILVHFFGFQQGRSQAEDPSPEISNKIRLGEAVMAYAKKLPVADGFVWSIYIYESNNVRVIDNISLVIRDRKGRFVCDSQIAASRSRFKGIESHYHVLVGSDFAEGAMITITTQNEGRGFGQLEFSVGELTGRERKEGREKGG